VVVGLDELRCALTDYHAGSHGVCARDSGHDRGVGDAQVVDAVHFEVPVDD
jgi:hypothetical protein